MLKRIGSLLLGLSMVFTASSSFLYISAEEVSTVGETAPVTDKASDAKEAASAEEATSALTESSASDFVPGRVIVAVNEDYLSDISNSSLSAEGLNSKLCSPKNDIFKGFKVDKIKELVPSTKSGKPTILKDKNGNSSAYSKKAGKLLKKNAVKTFSGDVQKIGSLLVVDLENQDKQSVLDTIAELEKNPNVIYAEPDYIATICTTVPNDTYYNYLWGMPKISAPSVWNAFTGSPSVVVGVVDSGIDYNHPDLAANIWTNSGEIANGIDDDGNGYVDDIHGWNLLGDYLDRNGNMRQGSYINANGNLCDGSPMDDNSHGTHVSGTIGAVGNNGIGVAGVNWNVKMAALKIADSDGSCDISAAVDAVNYADTVGINILNNSWGGGSFSTSLELAIENYDGLYIAAAGNSGINSDTYNFYPACYDCDNIISVAATTDSDELAYFSNYGATTVDLAAPGYNTYSCLPNSGYGYKSGTSMATPHVTGAVALLSGFNPDLTTSEIKSTILNNVDSVAALSGKTVTGGRLNVNKMITSNLSDGLINPGTDTWWTSTHTTESYMGDGTPPYYDYSQFNVSSINVICNGEIYSVPSKTFIYRVVFAWYDYDINSDYELCVKVNYSGTAEYYLDSGNRILEVGYGDDIAYFDDYALIPVVRVYSDSKGQLHQYNAAIADPVADGWWTNTCGEESYMGDGTPPLYPYSFFSVDSTDVIVNGVTYTVPSKTFVYRVVSAWYDFMESSEYGLAVKVEGGQASYVLTDPFAETGGEVIFTGNTIIPILDMHTDGECVVYVDETWF